MTSKISRPGGETPVRSKSAASTDSRPASVFRAQILNVNARDFTVDVQYESYPYATHFGIPWLLPYLHQNQGEGINIMPEVGSTVWVCNPSESGKDAFVLGWTPINEGGTYRAGRQLLNPGDIQLNTRDGNFLFLRRGGIIQIGATPVCQRLYIPIRNIIRDFAENYEMTTPAGDLTWQVARTEQQSDGHQACLFTLGCKEFSDDPNEGPLVVLKIGSHGDGNDTILSLQTRDKGGGSINTSLEITKSGQITWTVQDDITWNIKGNITATINKKIEITSKDDMSLESKANAFIKAVETHIAGGNAKLDLTGPAALNGDIVNLGDARFFAVAATPSLVAWIQAVTALLTGPPSAIAFKGILPPVVYQSTKVKV